MRSEPLSIDLFCRVVDNLGDIGVCWRLARRLETLGCRVRLIVDDLGSFSRIEPRVNTGLEHQSIGSVDVWQWAAAQSHWHCADAVIEAFACDMPEAARQSLHERKASGLATVWINLEYLTAEDWAAGCHGLPSPQAGGLVRHFFFPGFGTATGGLLGDFKATGQPPFDLPDVSEDELRVSLFCYPDAPIETLLQALARLARPVRLLAPRAIPQPEHLPGQLRWQAYDWLDQGGFDALLACCDLNLVRGEDSFVRAQHAGRPMLWQAYSQAEQAHLEKLRAWQQCRLEVTQPDPSLGNAWTRALEAWNGGCAASDLVPALSSLLSEHHQAWAAESARWATQVAEWPELGESLLAFIRAKL